MSKVDSWGSTSSKSLGASERTPMPSGRTSAVTPRSVAMWRARTPEAWSAHTITAPAVATEEENPMADRPRIVLVHGAWADGSCWSAVIESLQSKEYTVTAPQFPETSLEADVARLRQVLRRQGGP